MNSVLLDTSFLISFSDPARPHHAAALLYYRECVRRQIPLYLSTIVISEFQVKQAISHLLSEDVSTLAKYLDRARDTRLATTKAVLLRHGFDTAWFENGQTRLLP